jgi:hypothetical protein
MLVRKSESRKDHKSDPDSYLDESTAAKVGYSIVFSSQKNENHSHQIVIKNIKAGLLFRRLCVFRLSGLNKFACIKKTATFATPKNIYFVIVDACVKSRKLHIQPA